MRMLRSTILRSLLFKDFVVHSIRKLHTSTVQNNRICDWSIGYLHGFHGDKQGGSVQVSSAFPFTTNNTINEANRPSDIYIESNTMVSLMQILPQAVDAKRPTPSITSIAFECKEHW